MTETRKLWDGRETWTLNVRTGVLCGSLSGYEYGPDTECRVRAKFASRAKSATRRSALADAYASVGMVKVRGNLGGTYWE